ncbi:carboxypeptidase-like regulatory domain-containing protein [Mucilaginibacter antarcticus]|uniref:carboxypeptidase-like regulatory domain-containing protein n=1 Tax=Mucilaginibacter antarcticus TaxID=1855725 RepID=UPI0036262E70
MIHSRALRIRSICLKINKKMIFRLSLMCSTILLLSFIPGHDDAPFDKLITALQHWRDTIPQEKVYVHMDKPYYALGDTIWFKGYVTIGSRHQLSKLSGAVYVDLINERDSLVKSLKLPVTAGMVMGDFVLVDDYKQGSYRIRAYTQWMRNAGPEYFFDRTFTVGDLLSNNLIAKADYQYRDNEGKQQLTALLHFTDDQGKALGERNLRYQIVIGNKTIWTQNIKTDALGSASIKIDNAGKTNLTGAYIRATIESANNYPITRDFAIKAEKAQSDVQFFPESGSIVNGIASKIGFKAIGVDGLGISIKGVVVDDTDIVVAQISTLHAGMGSFMLKPQAGKRYLAKVTMPDGGIKTMALPKAADEGYTLSVYQPGKDSVLIRINASANLIKQPQSVSLLAHTGGENIFSSTLNITKPITSVWLTKKDFPSGIAQFTLFDNTGQPINERIAFIRSKDLMELDMKTAKDNYKGKEHVKIELAAKDSKGKPTTGNFSVTVIDEGKMPVEESKESTIFSSILLSSDLKGYIERPNYYFTKETEEVNKALDNLMLTQGYRRFVWNTLDSLTRAKPKFEVEGLGAKITGRVATLTNQLLPNADVILNSVVAGVTKFTKTGADGRFVFDGIFLTDSLKFAVQARGAKGSDRVKVLVDSVRKQAITPNPNRGDVSTDVTGTLKEYIDNGKKLDDIYMRTGQLDKVHRLREVRIKARKPTPPPYANQMVKIPEGLSDQTIMMRPEDTVKTAISDWLVHRLKGVRIMPHLNIPTYPWARDLTKGGVLVPMKLYLDGREIIDPDEVVEILTGFQVQPESIYKFELVTTNTALQHILRGPAILIYTKRDYVRKNYNPSVANISPKGFNKVREFYSPRYDKLGSIKLPDLRTTVYWNPYLKTDANGKTAFNFFNADGPASYKIIVEGINADGELGRQVYRYTVDSSPAEVVAPALRPASNKMGYISTPFNDYNKRLPVEKVYLQTDKPYYNIGDTLWFKAYVVDGQNRPSRMSGLLYVEFNDDTLSNVRRVSLPIKDGMAWGQIPLSKKYSEWGL